MVYSVWTLYKSTSSRILGVNSRKSRTERSMSLDCVTYLPTMSMSAPWSSASLAVSGTIPPATAIRNFLLGNCLAYDFYAFQSAASACFLVDASV
jgi:hypothetical protein